ncbi:MAG TPA: hypothetical protein DEG69_04020 [Flavobacteriaceae bacterium]|nr:hypothetical protein [Flavobacteriaceae bacterium]
MIFQLQRSMVLLFLFAITFSYAQVGINTTTPNPDAILDVTASDKGFLLPRIALVRADLPTPLSSHVAGMMVYNTATAGSSSNKVVPGYYYNDGTKWLEVANSDKITPSWSLTGNAITSPAQNFLGTTNLQPLTFRVDNTEYMRINNNGTIGIGNTNRTYTLDITGSTRISDQLGIGIAPNINLAARLSNGNKDAIIELKTQDENKDGYIRFTDNASTKFSVGYDGSNNDFRFNTGAVASKSGGSPLMIDGETGFVGVGVSSTPHKRLTVYDSKNRPAAVIGAPLSTGDYTGLMIGYYQEVLGDLHQKAGILFESTAAAKGTLHFVNNNDSGSANATLADARISIARNGNVGVGTSTPTSELEVINKGENASGSETWMPTRIVGNNDHTAGMLFKSNTAVWKIGTAASNSMNSFADHLVFGGDINASNFLNNNPKMALSPTGDLRLTLSSNFNGTGRLVVEGENDNRPILHILREEHNPAGDKAFVLSQWASSDQVVFNDLGGAIFNEEGNDTDFRIESDTNAHALFVNGSTGNIGIGENNPTVSLEVNGADAIKIPNGTSAERPTPEFGMIRYNSDIGRGEMYFNDVDGDGTQGDAGWRPI